VQGAASRAKGLDGIVLIFCGGGTVVVDPTFAADGTHKWRAGAGIYHSKTSQLQGQQDRPKLFNSNPSPNPFLQYSALMKNDTVCHLGVQYNIATTKCTYWKRPKPWSRLRVRWFSSQRYEITISCWYGNNRREAGSNCKLMTSLTGSIQFELYHFGGVVVWRNRKPYS
jgi:hypothetical protein